MRKLALILASVGFVLSGVVMASPALAASALEVTELEGAAGYDWEAWFADTSQPIPWTMTWTGLPAGVVAYGYFASHGTAYLVSHNLSGASPQNVVLPVALYGGVTSHAASVAPDCTFDPAPAIGDVFVIAEIVEAPYMACTHDVGAVSYAAGGGGEVTSDPVSDGFTAGWALITARVGNGVGVVVTVLLFTLGVGLVVRYLRRAVRAA